MSTDVPIYHSVCHDLKVYPQAMSRSTHEKFMRDHGQADWLAQAQFRAYNAPVASLGPKPKRPSSKRPSRRPRKRR